MARIFVTGASGFVGSRLIDLLVDQHDVWALVRKIPDNSDPRVRWVMHDLSQGLPIVGLPRKIDAVAHLAQAKDHRNFPAGARDMFAITVNATAQLLEWAVRAGATRFLLASTGGVYGTKSLPAKEDDRIPEPEGPLAFYFSTKLMAERLVFDYSQEVTGTVLRYFFVYGSGQGARMLMPRLLDSVKTEKAIQLSGHDGMRFNPVHVSDAAKAAQNAIFKDCPGILNVAGPEVTDLRTVCGRIGDTTGNRPVFEVRESENSNDLIADTDRAKKLLGVPTVGINEGLADLCKE